jgi:hypothetical protein
MTQPQMWLTRDRTSSCAKFRLLYLAGQLRAGGQERQLFYLLQAMDRRRYNPVVFVGDIRD